MAEKWIKGPPTEAGWYWWYEPENEGSDVAIVFVIAGGSKKRPYREYWFVGCHEPDDATDMQERNGWHTPLTPPNPPEEKT